MEKLLPLNSQLLSLLFFPLTILYEELLLRVFTADIAMFDYHLLFVVAYSIAAGIILWLAVSMIPSRNVRTGTAAVITGLLALIFSIEYGVKAFFKTFFEFSHMLGMAGDVAGQFTGETLTGVMAAIPFLLASFIPLIVLLMLRKHLIPEHTPSWKARFWVLTAFVLLHCCTTAPLLLGVQAFREDKGYFTTDYTASSTIPRFGALTSIQLELLYSIIGVPEEGLVSAPNNDTVATLPEPTAYGYHILDIDFNALVETSTDKTITSMHQYFSSLPPTQKNVYTGMFEGKNLILICAEAFSPYVIDPELTPVLYQMTTEGFVFNNYYQPDWTQSTFGGEFAAMTGLIPTWINGTYSFTATADNYMPFALGNQFRSLGYATRAYHNHYYAYYGRQKTHPNLGYDYKGISGGLKLAHDVWPNSDLEMMQATVTQYIDNYVNSGEHFHTYYMTVSGHTNYSWAGNAQSRNHKAEVADLEYSETIKAYLACQLEVEYALQYILEQLNAAGIADDTVIALTADHYPYALTESQSKDYYQELEPIPTTEGDLNRYRNTFLLWSAGMEEPVVVDTPCSSIDIIPTLSNLFGLEYDSRLLSGRDILSTNYSVDDPNSPQPLVVFVDKGSGCSWISQAGAYNAAKGTFTPAEGYEEYAENADYISAMSQKAKTMTSMSKNIVSKDYYAAVFPEEAAQ